MIASLQGSLNRNHSSSSSSSSSHNTGSSTTSHSTAPISPEPWFHVGRKLTKKRRPQSCPDPNRTRPHPADFISLPENTFYDIESPQLSEGIFPPVSERVFDENLPPAVSNANEQILSLPRRSPRPSWGNGANGEGLITRWSRMDVPDDVLIAHLEALRKDTGVAARLRNADVAGGIEIAEEDDSVSSETQFLEDDDRKWKKARTTLFCCREIIRTELSYLEGLLQLENGETTTSPPKILTPYLPALVASSIQLSIGMLSDPTAYGVSRAFVEAERQLENAFIPWCGVVGEAFIDEKHLVGHCKPTRSTRTMSGDSRGYMRGHSSATRDLVIPKNQNQLHNDISKSNIHVDPSVDSERSFGGGSGVIRLFKRLSLNSSRNSSPTIMLDGPHIDSTTLSLNQSAPLSSMRPRSHSNKRHTHKPSADSTRDSLACFHDSSTAPGSRRPSDTRRPHQDTQIHRNRSARHASRRVGRVPAVKDLAIQPTQRVTRYVLLYRDLLGHTPDSLSRPCVESALESAIRIARKCDRAQSNAAFLRSV